MIQLHPNQIQLGAAPAGKVAAIHQVGQLLVKQGNIHAGYIDSMLGREAIANTYLGNGIAIPHGLPKDHGLIQQTGLAILQIPGGVSWNEGEKVHLVVGIAAKSDEHIAVLRRLTRVLGDKQLVSRLSQTNDYRDIIEALTGERPADSPTLADYPLAFETVIPNKTGLHARPATNFVELARQFPANVRVRYGQRVADGKSMMELLQLGAEQGANLTVSAEGAQAADLLAALKEAIANGLGDEAEPSPAGLTLSHDWQPNQVQATITGIPASAGLVISQIRQHTRQKLLVEDSRANPGREGEKLQNAISAAQKELEQLYEDIKQRLGSNKATIFRSHSEFLNDINLIRDTIRLIFDGHNAAWAWQQVIEERVSQIQKLDDPVLAGRAIDLSDVGERVLAHLLGLPRQTEVMGDRPVILIAPDLTPSDTATLDPDLVVGFVTAIGGPTSHSAIMARSMGIPAMVAAGNLALSLANGLPAILDGYHGKLYIQPSEADLLAAARVQQQLQAQLQSANSSRFEAAQTLDGRPVEIGANINRASDAPKALEAGAEGVGLMRTEFLFLERDSIPTEDEQFEAYREMVQALHGRPLIIRTLDIGGDKEVAYLGLPKEDNSFLGIRGIRLCLSRPELFIPQLRAIYRAATYGPLKIMFPMISTLEDFQQARDMAETIRQQVGAAYVPLGMMVEVPSAAIMADQFAKIVDFFSIGTNDLTQYVLAMDRLHPQLARQADGLHPAVLRMIDQTVRAAEKEDKWVGVCGGIAGDPKGALILTGLGVSELSLSVPNIPAIKAQIRGTNFANLQALAHKALACQTAAQVRLL